LDNTISEFVCVVILLTNMMQIFYMSLCFLTIMWQREIRD